MVPLADDHWSLDARFLTTVLEAIPAFLVRLDADLHIRYINHLAKGFEWERVFGSKVLEYIQPEYRPAAEAAIRQAQSTGAQTRYESLGQGDDGRPAFYETVVCPVPDPDGRVGVVLVATDMTERVKYERELRESREKLRIAVEATGVGLWTYDFTTDSASWSGHMAEIMGHRAPLSPRAYLGHVHPDDHAMVADAMAAQLGEEGREAGPWPPPHRVQMPSGAYRWILCKGEIQRDDAGRPVRAIGGSLDVTEQKLAEERLRESQKRELVGTFTAGMAHNFNNTLAAIRPSLDLLMLRATQPDKGLLEAAIRATERASDLVRQLLSFAGQNRPISGRAISLCDIACAAREMCGPMFGSSPALHVELPDEAIYVRGDASRLEQVVVNLLVNARDACEEAEREDARVTIRCFCQEEETAEAPRRVMAVLEVSDNGAGMDAATRTKAFEPFFTTKPSGRGTGLGLPTCVSIIEELGGTLTCSSQPGEGSVFRVLLPSASPDDKAQRSTSTQTS